ncbi:MAG TPA: hypothetical protein VK469_22085 [Candidatus Kapabacteria bacterium]|nr:hypothetical protein [Candidatus Kapabacteria bacterium]
MNCIYCFISDYYQNQLKCQTNNIPRFEDRLLYYKEHFIKELFSLGNPTKCSCSKIFGFDNTSLIYWLADLLNEIKNYKSEIEIFFDEVINVYISFLKSRRMESIKLLSELLISNKILEKKKFNNEFENLVFFRGRRKNSSNFTLNDFYHIPFSERYRIKNRRFSYSGHPLLYLGSTVLCVCHELDELDINKIEFTSFFYDPNSKNSNINIYDITNEFESLIKILTVLAKEGIIPKYCDEQYIPNCKTLPHDIKKFILSQLLTFKRENKDTPFAEEYVLPQILTECLIYIDFDGVYYPSTKLNDAYHRDNFYRNNLALFPKYSPNKNYDLSLVNKFKIKLIDKSHTSNYSDVLSKISSIKPQTMDRITKARIKINLESLSQLEYKNIEYFKTDFGRIELLGYNNFI